MITDLTLGENIFNSPDLSIKMKILHAVNKSLDQITVAEMPQRRHLATDLLPALREQV